MRFTSQSKRIYGVVNFVFNHAFSTRFFNEAPETVHLHGIKKKTRFNCLANRERFSSTCKTIDFTVLLLFFFFLTKIGKNELVKVTDYNIS